MDEQIAAQIYLANPRTDTKTLVLEVLSIVGKADVSKVLEIYKKISKGEILVAHICSSINLETDSKNKIESFVGTKYSGKKIVYFYETDIQTDGGINIFVADDRINFGEN